MTWQIVSISFPCLREQLISIIGGSFHLTCLATQAVKSEPRMNQSKSMMLLMHMLFDSSSVPKNRPNHRGSMIWGRVGPAVDWVELLAFARGAHTVGKSLSHDDNSKRTTTTATDTIARSVFAK